MRLPAFLTRSSVRTLVPVFLAFSVFLPLAAYSLSAWRWTAQHPFRPLPLQGKWIQAAGAPTRAGYFRKRFDVTSEVRHAWIVIASSGGAEVSVNRNPMGRAYLWRPTRPYQSGTSERGQMLHAQDPALALNFPREYQWSGHDNWRLPFYVDLTNSFQLGKNVVCVEIESRNLGAVVSFHGAIELWTGEVIPIASDSSWFGEPTPPGPQVLDWTETLYWDKSWRFAQETTGPAERVQRIVPEPIFSHAFRGEWLRHPTSAPTDAVCFRKTWEIDRPVDEAWVRVITNRRFEVYVNEQRVAVPSTPAADQDNGDWILGKSSAMDPIVNPELLDPDEVGSLFVGDSFESPRKADQSLDEFIPVMPMHNMPFLYERTTNRSEPAGVYDPERTLAESRRTPSRPDYYPERPIPNALKRERSAGGFFGYSIAPLLQQGRNTIEVRCVAKSESNWSASVAIDGGYTTKDGETREPFAGLDWETRFLDEAAGGPALRSENPFEPSDAAGQTAASQAGQQDSAASWHAVISDGPVDFPASALPKFHYRGIAWPANGIDLLLVRSFWELMVASAIVVIGALGVAYGLDRRTGFRGVHVKAISELLYSLLLIASASLATLLLVSMSWKERHESIWFEEGTAWRIGLILSVLAVVGIGCIDLLGRSSVPGLRRSTRTLSTFLLELPETRFWSHLVLWVLLLCVLTRAYKLDLQPLDDDEYASTQAVLAILETGAPAFVADDVYYTRSPLFHYLAAALAYPFGGDLWSLRLQTVGWSVATVWLTYLCGARLMGSRWVGLAAMFLMTIHPLEVFTGHVIRFYQIQQFFALWTVYLFCIGFVTQQSQTYRVWTILAFAGAVLSQEITASMAVPILFCYVVFAKDLGWRNNIQLIVVAGLAGLVIALDFVAFQTLCLTRTEGVSPTVEATVKPHFWQPMNFFSLLIGYSRLHVVLSAFLLVGIPLLWRESNRNTLAILAFLVSGVVMTNLLVTNVSLRYMYWLFPMWGLLSVECIRLLLSQATSVVYPPERHLNRYVTTMSASSVMIVGGCVLSFSPWRMIDSYEMTILGDSTGCVRYVHAQMRDGDRIAITEPHTHAAFLEHGKVDYDVSIPLLYDFAVMRDGHLIDRNGGGRMVSSLDSLKHEFTKDGRVWILVNREKFRTRGKNLRWEYPGARFEMFLRKNCELKYRTYLWNAYLWDPARGFYAHFRSQE